MTELITSQKDALIIIIGAIIFFYSDYIKSDMGKGIGGLILILGIILYAYERISKKKKK